MEIVSGVGWGQIETWVLLVSGKIIFYGQGVRYYLLTWEFIIIRCKIFTLFYSILLFEKKLSMDAILYVLGGGSGTLFQVINILCSNLFYAFFKTSNLGLGALCGWHLGRLWLLADRNSKAWIPLNTLFLLVLVWVNVRFAL